MGCDIHSHAERKNESGQWEKVEGLRPFDYRSYGTFGFLAGVRNYSDVKPIAERRGFPEDASAEVAKNYDDWQCVAHSASWLTVAELVAFDYEAMTEDRWCMRNNNGGSTCDPGEGKAKTFREFLGKWFFDDLEQLKAAGAERVVFWFDN